jgi:hypothetical protein
LLAEQDQPLAPIPTAVVVRAHLANLAVVGWVAMGPVTAALALAMGSAVVVVVVVVALALTAAMPTCESPS